MVGLVKVVLSGEFITQWRQGDESKEISYLNVNDVKEIKKNGNFLPSEIQLFLILPIQSNHLLSDKLRELTTDIKKGFKHLFPIEFKIQTFLKNHLHECLPILPIIDLDDIKKTNNIISNSEN